ncbi:hypothetical protein [Eupransor demetentiae]|uniref:hypothetical protein n=1 Tax=Eupransor demetentiae TaxID=3109584 RepID=UPI0032E35EEC
MNIMKLARKLSPLFLLALAWASGLVDRLPEPIRFTLFLLTVVVSILSVQEVQEKKKP